LVRATLPRKRLGARRLRYSMACRRGSKNLRSFPTTVPCRRTRESAVQIQLARMKLLRPRPFGDCWLACRVWEELGLFGLLGYAVGLLPGRRAVGEGAAAFGGQGAARAGGTCLSREALAGGARRACGEVAGGARRGAGAGAGAGQERSATLCKRLAVHAPGLTVRATLEKLAGILMVEWCFPTNDGRTLVMPRYTEPNYDQELILHKLKLTLPAQPPPRISSGQLVPSV